MKSNFATVFLSIIGLGLIVCITQNENQRNRRSREYAGYEQTYRPARPTSHVSCEYEYVQPRLATQFNWTYGNGKSGFNVSYTYGTPVYRPCYMVKEKKYYVHPVTTYRYYW